MARRRQVGIPSNESGPFGSGWSGTPSVGYNTRFNIGSSGEWFDGAT